MYVLGDFLEKNYLKSMKWFFKSSNLGNSSADFNIGYIYYKGFLS